MWWLVIIAGLVPSVIHAQLRSDYYSIDVASVGAIELSHSTSSSYSVATAPDREFVYDAPDTDTSQESGSGIRSRADQTVPRDVATTTVSSDNDDATTTVTENNTTVPDEGFFRRPASDLPSVANVPSGVPASATDPVATGTSQAGGQVSDNDVMVKKTPTVTTPSPPVPKLLSAIWYQWIGFGVLGVGIVGIWWLVRKRQRRVLRQ